MPSALTTDDRALLGTLAVAMNVATGVMSTLMDSATTVAPFTLSEEERELLADYVAENSGYVGKYDAICAWHNLAKRLLDATPPEYLKNRDLALLLEMLDAARRLEQHAYVEVLEKVLAGS